MALVVHQFEVFVAEGEQVPHRRVDAHLGQGKGLAAELGFDLLEVIRYGDFTRFAADYEFVLDSLGAPPARGARDE